MHTLLIDAGGPSQRNGAELSRRDESAMTTTDIELMESELMESRIDRMDCAPGAVVMRTATAPARRAKTLPNRY
jgi:hypothetical protein